MKQHIKRSTTVSFLLAGALGSLGTASHACNTEPYMASICIMAWPKTAAFGGGLYAAAAGQTMQVQQYQALYSLIGNTYGGTPPSNFMLPDLRGRTIVGVGQGANLPNYMPGAKGGLPTITLTQNQLPVHVHALVSGATGVTATADFSTVTATTTNGTLAVNTTLGNMAANTTLGNMAASSVSGSSFTLNGSGSTTATFGSNPAGSSLGNYTSTAKIYSNAAPNVAMLSGAITGSAAVTLSGNPATTLSGNPTSTLSGSPSTSLSGSPTLTIGGNTASAGASAPIPAMNPFVALVYYIAVGGLYPTQD